MHRQHRSSLRLSPLQRRSRQRMLQRTRYRITAAVVLVENLVYEVYGQHIQNSAREVNVKADVLHQSGGNKY